MRLRLFSEGSELAVPFHRNSIAGWITFMSCGNVSLAIPLLIGLFRSQGRLCLILLLRCREHCSLFRRLYWLSGLVCAYQLPSPVTQALAYPGTTVCELQWRVLTNGNVVQHHWSLVFTPRINTPHCAGTNAVRYSPLFSNCCTELIWV